MSLLGIAALVPAVVIAGTVLLGGGPRTTAARPPSVRGGQRPSAAPHTWGAYVPPRTVVPTPARTQHASIVLMRPTPTVISARPTHTAASCPPEWRRWRWLWYICRTNANDRTGH